MPYTSKAAMLERYGERALVDLTDRDGAGVVDDAVLDRAIADAAAVIDSFVGGRYAVPLDPVPDAVPVHAAAIAYYHLHGHEPPPKVEADHKAAIAWLRDVGQGRIELVAAGAAEPARTASGIRTAQGERRLTRDSLRGL